MPLFLGLEVRAIQPHALKDMHGCGLAESPIILLPEVVGQDIDGFAHELSQPLHVAAPDLLSSQLEEAAEVIITVPP